MIKDKSFCTLYVVRHGETEYNLKRIMQGRLDSELTELGRTQARNRGEDLKQIDFDAVFSSDSIRAQKTAEIIKLDRELAVNTNMLLRERTFGHFDGKSAELFREQNKELFEKQSRMTEEEKRSFVLYEGYESDSQIAGRMLTFLREISVTYPGKKILVVSHGAIMRATLIHLGFGTFNQLPHGKNAIENLGYFVVESDGVDFFIKETRGVNKQPVN